MKNILTAALVVANVWAPSIYAQNQMEREGQGNDRDSVLRPLLRPSDRLLARAYRNVDALPEGLQTDVITLKESVTALADTWATDYRPGDAATLGDISEARDRFKADFADDIAANKELRKEVVRDLRNGLRDRFKGKEWNEEARALYRGYQAIAKQLATVWREARAALGDDATREDLKEAKHRFNEANADLIAEQKEVAQQIRNLIKENTHHDRPVEDRKSLPPELQALRDEMRALRGSIRARKHQAREDLRDLSPEEREAYRLALLGEFKDAHDDIKARRRKLIEDLRNEQDGDRRTED